MGPASSFTLYYTFLPHPIPLVPSMGVIRSIALVVTQSQREAAVYWIWRRVASGACHFDRCHVNGIENDAMWGAIIGTWRQSPLMEHPSSYAPSSKTKIPTTVYYSVHKERYKLTLNLDSRQWLPWIGQSRQCSPGSSNYRQDLSSRYP